MKKLFIYSAFFFFVGCTSINPPSTNNNTDTNTTTEATPIASFSYSPTIVREGQKIGFTNTSTDYDHCIWDFGDNTAQVNTPNPLKIFTSGVWTVKLTCYSKTGSKLNSTTKTVNVLAAYTKLYVASYTVNQISFLNSSSVSWDTSSGPDIYLNVYDNSTSASLFTTGHVNDVVQSAIPYTTDFKLTFLTLTKSYTIYMYDWDGIADDLMSSFNFKISDYIPTYPSTIVLTNGSFKITLNVEWQ